jgi:hypothetical protein
LESTKIDILAMEIAQQGRDTFCVDPERLGSAGHSHAGRLKFEVWIYAYSDLWDDACTGSNRQQSG